MGISGDSPYLLFSFSQGHGIGLYFLSLCCVAQPAARINTKRIIINMLECLFLINLMKFIFLKIINIQNNISDVKNN